MNINMKRVNKKTIMDILIRHSCLNIHIENVTSDNVVLSVLFGRIYGRIEITIPYIAFKSRELGFPLETNDIMAMLDIQKLLKGESYE